MWPYIEKLQSKPIAVRKKILIISSTLLTLLIIAIWLSVVFFLPTKTKDYSSQNKASFLESFSQAFSDIFSGKSKEVFMRPVNSDTPKATDFESEMVPEVMPDENSIN